MSAARHAIYACPAPRSAAWEAGSRWLGRCAMDDSPRRPPGIAGVDAAEHARLIAAARRYGFHATLKAPFHLAPGETPESLESAFAAFAAGERAYAGPPLSPGTGLGFLALSPRVCDAALEALAARCVAAFDRFRAAPGAEELARRRAATLTARQDTLLLRWGYPFVLEEFRFHYSLTGHLPQDAGLLRALRSGAAAHFRDSAVALGRIAGLALFTEPGRGANFRLVRYLALGGAAGRLVYVVGPSGAGKDSVMRWARERLPAGAAVHFARRTVTRAAAPACEDHDSVDREGFERLRGAGAFAMWWEAHGHLYGIGGEVTRRLAEGQTVVVSGSREHLAAAALDRRGLEVVQVVAAPERLRERLAARGREPEGEVRARVARQAPAMPAGVPVTVIANDGPLELAGQAFLDLLVEPRAP